MSILRQLNCRNCGAPLTGSSCEFCSTSSQPQAAQLPPLDVPPHCGVVLVGGHHYWILGQLAQGRSKRVFLARRRSHLSQLVVLKVAGSDPKPLQREWEAVQALHRVAAQEGYLRRLLPQPVAWNPGKPALAAYRWRSGFFSDFSAVRAAYPQGVDPQAVVWMGNRLLDQLQCLHRLGYAHGGICPPHLLVHPGDQGLILSTWSTCGPGSPQADLRAAGSCLGQLLAATAPPAFRRLWAQAGDFSQAATLQAELQQVAQQCFGPPRFQPFELPE